MDKQAELAAKLEALKQNFLAQLPSRFDDIEQNWDILNAGDWDADVLATVHRLVHSLTGTSGTFGLMDLCQQAREVEILLKALVTDGVAPDNSERAAIGAMLMHLREGSGEAAPVMDTDDVAMAAFNFPDEQGACVLLSSRDEELVQELSAQMGYFGYELAIADDPAELLEVARELSPVALIIDARFHQGACVNCPVIPQLQNGRSHNMPVIFVADTGTLDERLQAVRAGCAAYLIKPVDITVLVDHLDRLTWGMDAEPYRILVVDDEPSLAERYTLLLESAGMTVRAVTEPRDVMPELVELQPDLMLMDLYMPEFNGTELAQVIRQQEAYVSLPIVFLSSETDMDKQFDAMSIGGDDFLTKPIQDGHLIKAVRNRASRSRVLTSMMARDSLTGLLKHTKIKEVLGVELSRAKRQGSLLSYVMLDIDFFKRVNDTYGHLAGDRVIKSLGHLLRQRLRKSDIIGRYGGEEFAVIMPDTGKEEAAKVIDSVRIGFSMVRHNWHEEQIGCTFSAGVASFPAHSDPDELTNAADEALYRAKGAGRNCLVID